MIKMDGTYHRTRDEKLIGRVQEVRVQGANKREKPRKTRKEEVRLVAQERDKQQENIGKQLVAKPKVEGENKVNSTVLHLMV